MKLIHNLVMEILQKTIENEKSAFSPNVAPNLMENFSGLKTLKQMQNFVVNNCISLEIMSANTTNFSKLASILNLTKGTIWMMPHDTDGSLAIGDLIKKAKPTEINDIVSCVNKILIFNELNPQLAEPIVDLKGITLGKNDNELREVFKDPSNMQLLKRIRVDLERLLRDEMIPEIIVDITNDIIEFLKQNY